MLQCGNIVKKKILVIGQDIEPGPARLSTLMGDIGNGVCCVPANKMSVLKPCLGQWGRMVAVMQDTEKS
jgi:hypothetical protein